LIAVVQDLRVAQAHGNAPEIVTYGCGENGAAFIIWVDCFKISPLVIG
jgi:hypothetical protein